MTTSGSQPLHPNKQPSAKKSYNDQTSFHPRLLSLKKQTIDSPASQYTPYRTSQGKQECLTTQRGKIIDNILISRRQIIPKKEKKAKGSYKENRFADLLQKFDFAQKISLRQYPRT